MGNQISKHHNAKLTKPVIIMMKDKDIGLSNLSSLFVTKD
jgi:hypothetical protein